jgi:hypothetical protein
VKYVGITPQGKEIFLSPPVTAKLNRSQDAPADGFTGVFPLEKNAAVLTGLRIYNKHQVLCFDGIVDELRESLAGERTLTLIARSRAALLLDNEALPQTYRMPCLQTIFERHIAPYGFQAFKGENRVFNGELMVTKGMSEWQAAESFCTQFLKESPRIAGNVFDVSGERGKDRITFSNTGGTSYSSVVTSLQYYKLYSEMMVKSGKSGNYAIGARDEAAVSLGIQRRRYLRGGGKNADALVSASARSAFRVVLTCPGEVTTEILTEASVQDTVLGTMDGLYVSEISYCLDANGEKSTVILRRW